MKSDHINQLSIRTVLNRQLITHQVILFALVTLIMAGTAYLGGQNQLEELLQTTHLLSILVDEHIDSASRVISVLAAQPPEQEDLGAATETYAIFDVIYHLDQDGNLVGISPPHKQNLLGMDMSTQPFFNPAQVGLVISSPFISTHTGNPTVYLSIPIANQEGMVVGELSLTNLQESVIRKNISQIGIFYILDQRGYLLAHPQYDLVRLYENFNQIEIIERANQGGKYQFFLSEGDLLVATAAIVPITNWVAITQAPLTAVYGPYLTPAILGLLLGLLLFFVIGKRERAGITRKVVDPLSELSQEVESIAVGDYSQRSSPPHPAVITEVYSLEDSFERMKAGIQSRQAALSDSEERFRSQSEFLQTVLDSLTHPFYVIDVQDMQVLMVNAAAYQGPLLGDLTCYAFIHGNDQPCETFGHTCPMVEIKKTKKPVVLEHIHPDKAGQPRYYDVHGFPILDGSGEVIQMIEYSLDISERKQLEKQGRRLAALEERERIGRELHDDLGQVMGYVSVQAGTALQRLENREVDEAKSILNQLAEVARDASADVRKYILGIRTTGYQPPADFFAELGQFLEVQQQHYDLETQVSLPDDWLDNPFSQKVGLQLLRIIQEALTNVRKHAGVNKSRLLFTQHVDEAQVIIEDEGCGFDPSLLNGDHELGKADPDGHFGLTIMRERAESVGGSLEIRSEPGEWTKVIVRLPLMLESAQTEPLTRGIRVLLVDDHPLYLEGLRNLLASRGFQVVAQAHDGMEAIERARALHPDLILMDVQMPRMNGVEATRRIKVEQPEIKIVMLTMAAESEILFDALKGGASGYLLKSLDGEKFFSLLSDVMRGEVILSPTLANQVLAQFTQQSPQLPDQQDTLTHRQQEVLTMVAQGKSNKEIATVLTISRGTVKYHVSQILERLHLRSRHQMAQYALEHEMLSPPDE